MFKSTSLRRHALLACAATAALSTTCAYAALTTKPNVLVLMVDDVGFSDIGAYGSEINTPNIDSLTQQGLQFTDYNVQPRCSPSRGALMTGQTNQLIGFTTLIDNGQYLNMNNVFMPEVLKKNAGYDTYMSGKWHLGSTTNFGTLPGTLPGGTIPGNNTVDPRVRGFDSVFSYIDSAHSENAWDPSKYRLISTQVPTRTYVTSTTANDYVRGQTFNQTDAITDYALDFIHHTEQQNAANGTNNPFMEYVAYGSAHFPLGAPEYLIQKYYNYYLTKGWDNIRSDRLAEMIQKGIIDPSTILSPRSDVPLAGLNTQPTHQIPAWNSLPADRQADLAKRMAIYAADIENTDINVGRIITDLKSTGQFDNTLIMFSSDNGGNMEWHEYGSTNTEAVNTGTNLDNMGTAAYGNSVYYGTGWANVSNTPFQLYKHYTYEGGIKSPFIVSWPDGLDPSLKGKMTDQAMQINDIEPTVLGLLGLSQPTTWTSVGGTTYNVAPWEKNDKSMANFLTTGTPVGARDMAWAHESNRAYRSGDWKIVYTNFAQTNGTPASTWVMFNLATDPTELTNLANSNPRLYNYMVGRWQQWGVRNLLTDTSEPIAPLPIAPESRTLFLDQFGRADNNNISAATTGMGGSLVTGGLGTGAWVESYEGGTGTSSHTDSIRIVSGQLQLANGAGMSNMYLNHNFIDSSIITAGGFHASMMVTNIDTATSDAENRFAGFGFGLTLAEAGAAQDVNDTTGGYRGLVATPGHGVADFFVDIDLSGTLRVWHDGTVLASTEMNGPYGVIDAYLRPTSFNAGSTVPYDIFFNGEIVPALSGAFTWDNTNANYWGLSARATNVAWLDNVEVALGGSTTLYFTGSAANGNWNINSTTNFTQGLSNSVFRDGDSVVFDNAAASSGHNTGQFNVVVAAGGVNPGSLIINSNSNYTFSGGAINGTTSLNKSGLGTLTLSAPNGYTGGTFVTGGTLMVGANGAVPLNSVLAVSVGANVVIDHGAGSTITLDLSKLSNAGLIDLKDNRMVIHNATAATSAFVFNELQYGYNGGAWTGGHGITSSNASGTSLYTLGEALSGTDLKVFYTYYGDADLTGTVNGNDYTLIDNGFAMNLTGWQNGDFNYDGKIDGSDYSLIDNAFNVQGAAVSALSASMSAVTASEVAGTPTAVPEPTAGLLLMGLGAMAVKRSRRSL